MQIKFLDNQNKSQSFTKKHGLEHRVQIRVRVKRNFPGGAACSFFKPPFLDLSLVLFVWLWQPNQLGTSHCQKLGP